MSSRSCAERLRQQACARFVRTLETRACECTHPDFGKTPDENTPWQHNSTCTSSNQRNSTSARSKTMKVNKYATVRRHPYTCAYAYTYAYTH
eukprot:2932074-Alexandrium_andersonii.AAC.1